MEEVNFGMAQTFLAWGKEVCNYQENDPTEPKYRQAVTLAPKWLEANYLCGKLLPFENNLSGALPFLQASADRVLAGQRGPFLYQDPFLLLGEAQAALGRHAAAEASVNHSLQTDPANDRNHLVRRLIVRGHCKKQRLDFAGADDAYREAAHVTPKWSIFPYLRGELSRSQGQFSAAIASYDEAAQRQISFVNPSSRLEESFSECNIVLPYPNDTELGSAIFYGRGLVREALGLFREAAEDLQRAVEAGYEDVEGLLALGRCFERDENYAAAVKTYAKVVEKRPEGAEEVQHFMRVFEAWMAHRMQAPQADALA